ncbi:glutathione S-transferase family protein [Shimia haliotis]|uniref:Glutathione S-transferase n=1 Tax=Shimia haliotis TaxID=1280847 RepID=A0A1I4ADK9_9RHOB|nr:glutathione S-transferase family protein [Shimia haliotis]SFK54041.1 glutathione S-transferase [Shimia haliotis]
MATLHSIAGSRSFRVNWLLHELGVPVGIVPYAITDGSLQSPEFKTKSPARRVPALEIDGRVLYESGAIVQYLCETRSGHTLMPAIDSAERADWLQWLHYAETLGAGIQNLNMQHLFLPKDWMKSPTVMGIETKRLAIALKAVEAALQDGRDHLLTSGFSAADVMMGFTLESASRYVRFDGFPMTAAYLARLKAREAYQAAEAAEGPQQFYTQDFYDLPEG